MVHSHWQGDMTTGNNTPPSFETGSTQTLLASKRSKFGQDGNARDELQDQSYKTIKIGSNQDRLWHADEDDTNPANKKLNVTVEKVNHEGWTAYRLRDNASGKLVAVDGDWIKVRAEEEADIRDTAFMFTRWTYQVPQQFNADMRDEYAWEMWFYSRGDQSVYIDDDGELNVKGSGRQALFF